LLTGIDHSAGDHHSPNSVVKSAGFDHSFFLKTVFDQNYGAMRISAPVVKNRFWEGTVVKSAGFDHSFGAMRISAPVVNSSPPWSNPADLTTELL
jgi:hypothetical protein